MLYQLSYTPKPAALPLLKSLAPRKWQGGNLRVAIARRHSAGLGSLPRGQLAALGGYQGKNDEETRSRCRARRVRFRRTGPEVNCLIFPALKKECWEKGAAMLKATPKTVATAVEATPTKLKLPMLWNCTAAPKGSGYLLDC